MSVTINAQPGQPVTATVARTQPYAFSKKRELKRAALAWARKVTGKPLGWKAARKLLKKAKAG